MLITLNHAINLGGKANEDFNIPLNSSLSVTLHPDDVSININQALK